MDLVVEQPGGPHFRDNGDTCCNCVKREKRGGDPPEAPQEVAAQKPEMAEKIWPLAQSDVSRSQSAPQTVDRE